MCHLTYDPVLRRCALILISFEAAQGLAAFVPPFAAGQFSVFAIQVIPIDTVYDLPGAWLQGAFQRKLPLGNCQRTFHGHIRP